MVRTTVVGSWPIPFGLKPGLTEYYKGDLGDEDARDVLQAAARIAMDEQRACGLDQIMGAKCSRRTSFTTFRRGSRASKW